MNLVNALDGVVDMMNNDVGDVDVGNVESARSQRSFKRVAQRLAVEAQSSTDDVADVFVAVVMLEILGVGKVSMFVDFFASADRVFSSDVLSSNDLRRNAARVNSADVLLSSYRALVSSVVFSSLEVFLGRVMYL